MGLLVANGSAHQQSECRTVVFTNPYPRYSNYAAFSVSVKWILVYIFFLLNCYEDKTASKSWVVPDWPLNGISPHVGDGSASWITLSWVALPVVCVAPPTAFYLETICSDVVFVLSAALMLSCRNAAVNFAHFSLPSCRSVSFWKKNWQIYSRGGTAACVCSCGQRKRLCVLRHTWTRGRFSLFWTKYF